LENFIYIYIVNYFPKEFFMNKFQKVGLAVIIATSMASAQLLWNTNALHGQVAFPWVVACKSDKSKFDEDDQDNTCYKDMGGWWFGYLAGPGIGANPNGCPAGMDGKDPGVSDINRVMARINKEDVTFVGVDNSSCEGPDITDRDGSIKGGYGGASLLDDGYLDLDLYIGIGNADDYDPDIAAFAVNFSNPLDPTSSNSLKNFTDKEGFCITYETSDYTLSAGVGENNAGTNIAFTLGWDESGAVTNSYRGQYDPWEFPLPAQTSGKKPLDMKFSDFEQAGWSCNNAETEINPAWDKKCGPLSFATEKMMSVKIRLQGYTGGEQHVKFKLYEFGFLGSCGKGLNPDGAEGEPVPVLSAKTAQGMNFTMRDNMLSASIKEPAMVQIYNLQGAIVKSQVLTPNSKMNLSQLPTGVYMVRAPSLGYTSRIMVK
jgi:hypothetical protein